jgi:hypothetical protein
MSQAHHKDGEVSPTKTLGAGAVAVVITPYAKDADCTSRWMPSGHPQHSGVGTMGCA